MKFSPDSFEDKLLSGWESVHKKGQLTLWVLLSLKDGPKHMQQIKDYVEQKSNDTISADDQSLYRSLRRYTDAELTTFTTQPGRGGPELKVYELTPTGLAVLDEFIQRNIRDVFLTESAQKLFAPDNSGKIRE